MNTSYPLLQVAVVMIGRDGRLLVGYNPKWRSFTLPMTKVRALPLEAPDAKMGRERPLDAALRAAVEIVGRPFRETDLSAVPHQADPYQVSLRDDQVKRYQFHLFHLRASFVGANPVPGHTAVWLTPEDLTECKPVSPTVRHLLAALDPTEVKRLAR